MRDFNYEPDAKELLTPAIVKKLTLIHEYKGKEALFLEVQPDALNSLSASAKIRSTDASNRIEGIYTTEKRLREIMSSDIEPRNRNEQEIAGYRDALALIHDNHEYMDLKPQVILQIHSILLRYSGYSFAGKWKDSDNAIIEVTSEGIEKVRFKPLAAFLVPDAVEQLCFAFNKSIAMDVSNPLVLIAKFSLDFTCIHPFLDGNGRMSRLLMLLLLYKSGYVVGKYISIEEEINRTKETYYEALQSSSVSWIEGKNDYLPYIEYTLNVILAAYKGFERRMDGLLITKMSKPERIEAVFNRQPGKVTKREIALELPDISLTTIERTLSDLLAKGVIKKVGAGRATGYVKVL